jgi:hypothetical protein
MNLDVTAAAIGRPETEERRAWLARANESEADYLLTLWPGETIGPDYLRVTMAAMARNPGTAWATTWCEPVEGAAGVPYTGADFSLPLELVSYHPVPVALIRHDAFQQVGGWNLELPPGWREWDLWLAFAEAGMQGVVVPSWHARFVPRCEYTIQEPESPDRLSLILEKIVARSPALFDRHGTDLWLHRMVNSLARRRHSEQRTRFEVADAWREFGNATKGYLKSRHPALARIYRAWRRRIFRPSV